MTNSDQANSASVQQPDDPSGDPITTLAIQLPPPEELEAVANQAAAVATSLGEPETDGTRLTAHDRFHSLASRYAMIGVWLVMAAIYGVAMPGKFLQIGTLQTIFGSQSALVPGDRRPLNVRRR